MAGVTFADKQEIELWFCGSPALLRPVQFNSQQPGWLPGPSVAWRVLEISFQQHYVLCVCVRWGEEGVEDLTMQAEALRMCLCEGVLKWLHAGCWKQAEHGRAWCYGNLQRSSLSLVICCTVEAFLHWWHHLHPARFWVTVSTKRSCFINLPEIFWKWLKKLSFFSSYFSLCASYDILKPYWI